MRPWQNAVALLATLFAAGALLPLAPHLRLLCGGLAIATILALLWLRVRAHQVRRSDARVADVYARIERIRGDRNGRVKRR
ncbi:MAG: hypothetical protein QOI11_2033 [Candidatus Eremiobacteraeota bacterium]|jgi:hypothetical protein|nr:hypothetical protein [Candidatus Eremiobacteraeota bacterium]